MTNLPVGFTERIKRELGDDFQAFLASYDRPAYKGVRVNTLKLNAEKFKEICPFPLGDKIPWEENGFYSSEEKVGGYAEHFAGLFYSQEPSAMYPAPLLDVKPGERVLDLCSAPGGKGTRLAEATHGEGIVALNEYVSSRAKILSQNVERMGVTNAVVFNESTERLADKFPSYFDKILVDAPCSGEGMFKKNEAEAVSNWSEQNVAACAQMQRSILDSAAEMLCGGGKLVYSTCTFSSEEDELQVEDFLTRHSEFRLIKEEKLYPHKIKGEGHFCAVFEKIGDERGEPKKMKVGLSPADEKSYRKFERDFLRVEKKNLVRFGDAIYSQPDGMPDLGGLNVLRSGLRVAEVNNGRIEPAHALAMSLKAEETKNYVSLTREEAKAYLRGETVRSDNANGWCVVGFGDYPLGTGKISGGTVKNHYPKGLRLLKS